MKTALASLAIAAALLCAQAAFGQDLAHRKADLTVKVQSDGGVPLEGAEVKVEMLNHAFRFGTSVEEEHINPEHPAFDPWTATEIEKRFNSLTFGNIMKWSYYEARTSETMLDIVANARSYRAFEGEDPMRIRGHATLWGAQYQLPPDVRNATDPAYLRNRILDHVAGYHATFKDAGIDNFDLYNEHFHETALLIDKLVPSKNMAEQAAEVATWFNKAKEVDPDAILFINEYNILNFWNDSDADVVAYKAFVDAVRDAGGQIDGIGLQGHMDRPTTTKAQLTRRLDLLAAPMAPTANHPEGLPGLRIEITELDMNVDNAASNNPSWQNATPEQQAQITANVLDAAFEHPSVDGVTIWGLNDYFHWRDNAIMYADLDRVGNVRNRVAPVLKQSGQVWIDRVMDAWWTDLSGSSDASGDFKGAVFKGKHLITVTFDGQTQTFIRDIREPTELTAAFAFSASDATTYEQWAAFIEWGEDDPAAHADPDEDGRSNFEEFVAGTNPIAWDYARAPTLLDVHTAQAKLRYSLRAADQNLIVYVEKSNDLTPDSWQVVALPEIAAQKVVEDGIVTYTVRLPTPFEPAFYRVLVLEASDA